MDVLSQPHPVDGLEATLLYKTERIANLASGIKLKGKRTMHFLF
jgi:hypothetical protein